MFCLGFKVGCRLEFRLAKNFGTSCRSLHAHARSSRQQKHGNTGTTAGAQGHKGENSNRMKHSRFRGPVHAHARNLLCACSQMPLHGCGCAGEPKSRRELQNCMVRVSIWSAPGARRRSWPIRLPCAQEEGRHTHTAHAQREASFWCPAAKKGHGPPRLPARARQRCVSAARHLALSPRTPAHTFSCLPMTPTHHTTRVTQRV